MKKGIIMEMNEDFLTLLTPDGEFLRANNHHKNYNIGQEIDFFPLAQEEGKSHLAFLHSFKGKSIFAAAILCVFLFAAIFPIFGNDNVYAYMSIDVNPSIELGVNEKFQVIEIIPYNKEGKQIIESLPKWKKKNIHELTSEIIRKMKDKGYLNNNHAVLLATVFDNEDELEKNERWKLEMAEIKAIVSNEHLELKVIEGSKEEREKAKEKGLSTGIYKENKQLKAKKPSNNIENSSPKESSEAGNKKDKNIPPGQAKKAESMNEITDGSEEKGTKQENKEKQVPPGQVKNKGNNEKNSSQWERNPNKEEKLNNKKNNFENKQKNNDKQKQQNNQQSQNNNNNKNVDKQHKGNHNNGKDKSPD